jgi:hypothetical protein
LGADVFKSCSPRNSGISRVIGGQIPLYPPLARVLGLTGTVEIQVLVDKGAILNAEVKSVALGPTKTVLNEEGKKKVGLFLSTPALENVKTWEFQREDRSTFLVKYIYQIGGEPTTDGDNPIVELDLPLVVRITSRPLKPICHDCGANNMGKVVPE